MVSPFLNSNKKLGSGRQPHRPDDFALLFFEKRKFAPANPDFPNFPSEQPHAGKKKTTDPLHCRLTETGEFFPSRLCRPLAPALHSCRNEPGKNPKGICCEPGLVKFSSPETPVGGFCFGSPPQKPHYAAKKKFAGSGKQKYSWWYSRSPKSPPPCNVQKQKPKPTSTPKVKFHCTA